MWAYEFSAESPVSASDVWRVLRDLDNWPSWDTSMEAVELRGSFGVGAEVLMRPKGQQPVTSVIVAADEDRLYADETRVGDVTLRFSHRLEPLADRGTRVIHRLEITGPAADSVGLELGHAIVDDFPEAMAALLERAAA